MKILESQSAVLSNYEVYAHLTAMRATPAPRPKNPRMSTPCSKKLPLPTPRLPLPRPPLPEPPYGAAALRALVAGLRPYDLTKSEVLMIANLRPEGLGLLDCVVEECDERFTAERQDEIVKIVGDVLGREGAGVDGDGVDGEDGPV